MPTKEAPAQFVHLETYGLKTTGKKHTVRKIVSEATRVPSYCRHVPNPEPPTVLFGSSPRLLPSLLKSMLENAKEASGKKARSTTQLLLAGVASYPVETALIEGDLTAFAEWCGLTVDWLKETYGDRLFSVVLHMDEGHPHVHFYAVPRLLESGLLVMEGLHPGNDANAASNRLKLGYYEKADAYKAAMKAMQDSFFESVGKPLGWLRKSSAPRPRISRAEWVAKQRAEKAEKALKELKEGDTLGRMRTRRIEASAGPC